MVKPLLLFLHASKKKRYTKTTTLRNKEEKVISDSKNKNAKVAGEGGKNNRQVSIQIIGDKKKTEIIKLKDPSNDEEELDVFSVTNMDLGKVRALQSPLFLLKCMHLNGN